MAVASAGPYADSLHLADNHTNTSSLNFYRPVALPGAQPTVSKALKAMLHQIVGFIILVGHVIVLLYHQFWHT